VLVAFYDRSITCGSYSLLEHGHLIVCQSICFSNDRNEVNLGMQSPHHLDVERLQRVARRLDEVDAGMNTVIHDVHAVDLVLGLEVCVKSLLNVLNDRSPGVVVVDEVTEAGCVDHGQSESDAIFFDVCADRLYGHSLWDDIKAGAFALSWRVEGSIEEGVDQGRLSETGLAWLC